MTNVARIESFKVGQQAVVVRKITQADIQKFVELTGDDNPLHTDETYAQSTSYKGIVVHGMLGASFISTLVGKHLPGDGALWISNKLDFHAPVRVNDELRIVAEVTAVHVKQSLLSLQVQITNQLDQKVTTAECKVKVLDDPKPKDEGAPSQRPKVALVTGGSSGIGAATVRLLSKQGYKVAFTYNTSERASQALLDEIESLGGEGLPIRADVTVERDVQRMVASVVHKFGHLTALVNGAAPRIVEKKFDDLIWDDFQRQIDGQVKSAFLCIKESVPHFTAAGGGSIVNIGSIVTDQAPPPTWTGYSVAKHGVSALTKTLAEVLGPRKIRINTVAPGFTDTQFVAGIPERARLMAAMQTPLRKIATAEEIAEVIAFSLGDGASHMTGETLRVNGGKTLL